MHYKSGFLLYCIVFRHLEDTLVSLQEAIADQNNIVRQQVHMIAAKEEETRLIQVLITYNHIIYM